MALRFTESLFVKTKYENRSHASDYAMNDPNRIDWAINPECEYQIGCIRTVQGLEMDYVGVIIGKDLGYDPETGSLIV